MSTRRKALVAVVSIPVGLLVVLCAAWGIDTYLHRDDVARNVVLAGAPVGGMSDQQLDSTISTLTQKLPTTPVVIDTGDFSVTSTAADLGLSINPTTTAADVKGERRDDPLPLRPFLWVKSLFSDESADVRLDVDSAKLDAKLTELEGDRRVQPQEPTLTADEKGVTLVPGKNGTALATAAVVESMPDALGDLGATVDLKVERSVLTPTIPDSAVQALADQANKVTEGKITVAAGDQSFAIDGPQFRPAFAITSNPAQDGGQPHLTMKPEIVADILAKSAPAGSGNPTGVSFDIQGGTPVPVAGHDAQVCCGPDAPDKIVAGLLAGTTKIDVPTKTLTAAEGVAWANTLGVNGVIGEFTTRHAAGEPRVTNIHKISDTTRGVLIAPGDTFSVNSFVGKRTAEKGYVVAPVIEDGKMSTDVGGGVSQFATTLFNAAFFGGLDIPAYKAHSHYISRYPYGREATLAYPGVDLKIHNNTPYGVVIWPTYTASSITIQLFSTQYATGAQTAQNQSSGCGKVTTERTRTFVDGHTAVDRFNANYDCNPE